MAKTHNDLLVDLATIVADYRQGEIAQRTPEIIEAWLAQFPAATQEPVLEGLVHVLDKIYISRATFKAFLASLASSKKLSHAQEPSVYWRGVRLLDIQQGGNSQKEILAMFDEVLQETHGFGVAQTDGTNGDCIYLDDCIGTGSRLRTDLCTWIETAAPQNANVQVITPALFLGSYWIDKKIQEAAKASGKTVAVQKWFLKSLELENRKFRRNQADVLWPTLIPNDPDVQAYANHLETLGHPFELRAAGNPGAKAIFADDAQKISMEQALLTRGCKIRGECDNLPEHVRPLGYHNLDSFGFGSMLVTYRNCPNNCPIALWVQQDAYPALLPRKTNAQAADQQLMQELFG